MEQGKSERQAESEAALAVSDVLSSIEHSLAHARRKHKEVAKDGVDTNRQHALADAVKALEAAHTKLMQDGYPLTSVTQRMF